MAYHLLQCLLVTFLLFSEPTSAASKKKKKGSGQLYRRVGYVVQKAEKAGYQVWVDQSGTLSFTSKGRRKDFSTVFFPHSQKKSNVTGSVHASTPNDESKAKNTCDYTA
eukprot:780284_1